MICDRGDVVPVQPESYALFPAGWPQLAQKGRQEDDPGDAREAQGGDDYGLAGIVLQLTPELRHDSLVPQQLLLMLPAWFYLQIHSGFLVQAAVEAGTRLQR
jgi:hypothetical protein